MNIPVDIEFKIRPKYPRPAKLSDPGGDFEPEELEAIIRKTDAELTDTDLRCIFQSYLPAGEYHECIPFLPLTLKRIVREDGDADLCSDVLVWIWQNADELKKDELYDELLKLFEDFFAEQTGAFIPGNDAPANCGMVDSLIHELNDIRHFDRLGDEFMRKYWIPVETYAQAAWLLYMLEENRYNDKWICSVFLSGLADDKKTLKKAYDLVVEAALKDAKLLEYWNRHLSMLMLGIG